MNLINIISRAVTLTLIALSPLYAFCETKIVNIKVSGQAKPLAIEDKSPTFSWQMQSDERGQQQTAYQIKVTDDLGTSIWNSGKVFSGLSVGIRYGGSELKRETSYNVALTVWDKDGQTLTANTTFETGLCDSVAGSEAQWCGAQWIGSTKPSLDAAAMFYYTLHFKFTINSGYKASVIFAANDFRFKNEAQNAQHMAGDNWYRLEFDLTEAASDNPRLAFYRYGYNENDKGNTSPILVIDDYNFPDNNLEKIFTQAQGKDYDVWMTYIQDASYDVQLRINDICVNTTQNSATAGGTGFNIVANSNNEWYTSFMHLNSVGFAAMPKTDVTYWNFDVRSRGGSEDNIVFSEKNWQDIFGTKIPNVTVDGTTKITVKNTSDEMTMGYVDPSNGAITMLRTIIDTGGKTVKKAKLYVTAMGGYNMFINGERMSNDWFAPESSQAREVLGYNVYDITSQLHKGKNVMAAYLIPCWWTGHTTKDIYNFNFYGDHEALLTKLNLTYADGTTETKVSNTSDWKAYNNGPIRYGCFIDGERYDARYEDDVEGWNANTDFDDSQWNVPDVIARKDWEQFYLMARYDEPVQVRDTITAVKLMPVHSKDGHSYTYNMGTNLAGVPLIDIPAGFLQAGDTVVIRYSEQIYPGMRGDDEFYVNNFGIKGKGLAGTQLRDNYRNAFATIFYVAKGSDAVTISPTTTYCGFQYLQITLPSHDGNLPLKNVRALVLSSDKKPSGTYECETSDGETGNFVNQLFKNIQRSQLGNFMTIPTDCPQRDERMGWTGDAQAYCRTATYNSDVYNFFRQWMVSLRADQQVGVGDWPAGGIGFTVPTYSKTEDYSFCDATTWSAAVCMVPWQLYLQSGDPTVIVENYQAMKDWLEGMAWFKWKDKHAESDYENLCWITTGFSEWLELTPRQGDESNLVSELQNNAMYIYMMDIMSQMADIVGDTEYAATMRTRHDAAKKEWNDVFVDPITHKTRFSNGNILHSQASYASPLMHGVFNEENRPYAIQYLQQLTQHPSESGDGTNSTVRGFADYTITTGFNGTPNMLPALSINGLTEDAYSLFTSKSYPSWLWPVTNGATSIWERWNGYESAFGQGDGNNMNSMNHFALGSVGQWMYEYQLGIAPSQNKDGVWGYKQFILQPETGGTYTSLKGSYDSNYGTIKSEWKADGHGTMTEYSCTIPPNTTCTLYLPATAEAKVSVDGTGCTFVCDTTHNGHTAKQYTLTSGNYRFSIQ